MNNNILVELCEIKRLLLLNKDVFTLKEFCQYADLSEDYVYKLKDAGKLKFYRPFGKKLYITKEDAIAVLKQNPLVHRGETEKQAIHSLFTSKNH